jgi:murein DD-endopeptidase MepM/ murein hydrolase activator NlpD
MRRGTFFAGVIVVSLLAGRSVAAEACWSPPVAAAVSDPFRQPACRWCPGNRGIEYATSSGDSVRAVAAGEVIFSGVVAGTAYVVVRHADRRRATYGNLGGTLPSVGQPVVSGMVIARTAGTFHFGLRDGDRYVDPAPFIGRLVGVARLIPSDGSSPGRAPAPRLVCHAAGSGGFGDSGG